MTLPLTQETMGELMLLLLLIIACARIFFIKNARTDPVATLPALCLALSVLAVIAWGLSAQSLAVLVLSASVFIWNFRALLRLNDNLIVDHYGVLFIISSLINLLLLLPAAALTIYFRPVVPNMQKYGVQKAQAAYCGSLADGFKKPEKLFEKKTAVVSRYEPKDGAKTGETIVFIPSECATAALYEPLLVKLARDGHTVYTADFSGGLSRHADGIAYTKPLRRATFCRMRLFSPDEYRKWESEEKADYFIDIAGALLAIVGGEGGAAVVVAGDGVPPQTFLGIQQEHIPVLVTADIAAFEDNPAPGWGMVEHTDPLTARLLGLSRDASMYTANHLAAELEADIAAGIAKFRKEQER